MRKDWKPVTLGEIALIQNGSTPLKSRKDYWESGSVPWFTIEDLRQQGFEIKHTQKTITKLAISETSVSLIAEDSILICCTASVGAVAINRIPLTTNQQFNGLTIMDPTKVDLKFLFYWFLTHEQHLQSLGRSTTISYVSMAKLKAMKLALPPLDEQKRIVAKLDEVLTDLDRVTANTSDSLAKIDSFWNSLLSEAFEYGLEAQNINDKYQWTTTALGDLLALEYGKPLDPFKRSSDGTHPVYGAAGIKTYSDSYLVDLDSIIIGRKGSAGELTRVNGKFWPLDVTYYVQLKSTNVDIDYLFNWLALKDLTTMAKGVKPGINRNEIYELLIQLPPLDKQKRMVAKLDSIKTEIEETKSLRRNTLHESAQFRSSILSAAFAGDF